jgi:hypothetical protein
VSCLTEPNNDIEQDFIKRRSDFQGLVMTAMTEMEKPSAWLNADYETTAPYFSENQTYEVTDITQGLYTEVLNTFQSDLNFTTKLYKRKDGMWGGVNQLPNGTIEFIGMLSNILDGSADLIATSFAMVHSRSLYVQYLPPVTSETGALFISNEDISEDLDYTTFVKPFSMGLWFVMGVLTIITTSFIYFVTYATHRTIVTKIYVVSETFVKSVFPRIYLQLFLYYGHYLLLILEANMALQKWIIYSHTD